MRLWARIFVVTAMSVCVAWGLSYLPELGSPVTDDHNEIQVFNNNNPIILTDDNIVDWITKVPIHLDLKRVDWSDRILSVDFELGTPIESSKEIYNQLLDFVYYGLGGTSNVDRVWVRIVQASDNGKLHPRRLLLALDANRGQIFEGDYELWKSGELRSEELINRRFQLTVTPQWTKRLDD